MLSKPSTCFACPLEKSGRSFSAPEGTGKNGVLIIGEALGDREAFDSLPFRPYAEAGSVLQTAMRLLEPFTGYDRLDYAMWNLVACQPPYNKLEHTDYEAPAILHCRTHFNRVFNAYKPKVILALGNLPLKYLWKQDPRIEDFITKCNQDITLAKAVADAEPDKEIKKRLREETKNAKKTLSRFKSKLLISNMRGYTLPSIYNVPIVASLHPSFINRSGRVLIGTLTRDLFHAINVAKGKVPKFTSNYLENPTLAQAEAFYRDCKANPHLPISHDIETPMTTLEVDEAEEGFISKDVRDIDSIQFSLRPGTGIFIPWDKGPFTEIAAKILALPNDKIGYNSWNFDEVNIEYHLGKGAIGGRNIDLRWAWKHLNSDFIKFGGSLQFATNFYAPEFPAWKHLAQIETENYGCLDVDSPQRIWAGIKNDFKSKLIATPAIRAIFGQTWVDGTCEKTLEQGFIDDIVELRPILVEMQDFGIPIDEAERTKFSTRVDIERGNTLQELQDMYPMELRKTSPDLGYKLIPKDIGSITKKFAGLLNLATPGKFLLLDKTVSVDKLLHQYIEIHSRRPDKNETGLMVKEFKVGDFVEKRWCHIEAFKPSSRNQVIKYLKYKKYKIPKKRNQEGIEVETSSKDEIYKLWDENGDPFLERIILFRELNKMQNTYAGGGKKEGWKVGPDGRIHTTFTFKPATGQLSSTNPNVQNAPARGTRFSSEGYKQLANDFRKIVAAGEGKVILSADWSSFHALTLGFESEDLEYMRLVRLDVHSYVAAWILSDELPFRLIQMKARKNPNEKELVEIAITEEAVHRLKSLPNWLSYSDVDLKAELSWIKEHYKFTRDSQAKPAILGMGFGLGVEKFFKMNRYSFQSKAQPQKILDLIRRLFPKTFVDYHNNIQKLAADQTYLISRYGYIRRFYDVFDWRIIKTYRSPKFDELIVKGKDGRWWLRKRGQDSNAAIAYLPANDAFGVKKEKMRELPKEIRKYMVNEIHDDLMFEFPEEAIADYAPEVVKVMESPAKALKNSTAPNGLVCKVELKLGKNWGELKNYELARV